MTKPLDKEMASEYIAAVEYQLELFDLHSGLSDSFSAEWSKAQIDAFEDIARTISNLKSKIAARKWDK